MEEFRREKRDGEVEDPVAEGDGGHQPLYGRHGDALAAVQMGSNIESFRLVSLFYWVLTTIAS